LLSEWVAGRRVVFRPEVHALRVNQPGTQSHPHTPALRCR
jgi:hypothetical protein